MHPRGQSRDDSRCVDWSEEEAEQAGQQCQLNHGQWVGLIGPAACGHLEEQISWNPDREHERREEGKLLGQEHSRHRDLAPQSARDGQRFDLIDR